MASRELLRQNLISVTSIDKIDNKYLNESSDDAFAMTSGLVGTKFRPLNTSFQSNHFRQIIENDEYEDTMKLENFKKDYS
jgi:hypothetical protein